MLSTEIDGRAPRVVVVSESESGRGELARALQKYGFEVAGSIALNGWTEQDVRPATTDLVVVDLNEDAEDADQILDLLELSDVPILFHDTSAGQGVDWGRQFARKFKAMLRAGSFSGPGPEDDASSAATLAGVQNPLPQPVAESVDEIPADPAAESNGAVEGLTHDADVEGTDTPAPHVNHGSAEDVDLIPEKPVQPLASAPVERQLEIDATEPAQASPAPEPTYTALPSDPGIAEADHAAGRARPRAGGAQRVWVLGASIGGPQAVKRFLGKIPGDLPVAFILAQHIGERFEQLLAEQLHKAGAFRVQCAQDGHVLRHGEVIVVPADKRFLIDEEGGIQLRTMVERGMFSPCIDDVIAIVARRYVEDTGVIIFSGMSDDGVRGCEVVAERGGVVWAQEAGSTVISSMPDRARRRGVVSVSGTPEALAVRLTEHLDVQARAKSHG